MKSGPKQIQISQSNSWLTSLKNHNSASYQRLSKYLETWEKDEQDKQCYQRIQELLKNEPNIVKTLNAYIQEDVQMKYVKTMQEMVDEWMRDMNMNNKRAFDKALKKLQQLHNEGVAEDSRIYEQLIDLFKDQPEVHKRLMEFYNSSKEQELTSHPPKKKKQIPPTNFQPYKAYEEKHRKYADMYDDQNRNRQQTKQIVNNPMEELFRFKKLESSLGPRLYETLVKVVYLFEVGVLSRGEVIALLPAKIFDSPETYELVKDSIETRDADRRRTTNVFKSLTDLNYSNSDRTTHSYVRMPAFYPIMCSGKAKNIELNNLLNVKWVILPVGSEHPNQFSVRPNNPYEDPLLKSEYERYEFDLNLYRYKQTAKLLDKMLTCQSEAEAEKLLVQAVGIGVVQNVYRNASKEQKEEIEVNLKTNRNDMVAILNERVKMQIRELEGIRSGTATKLWYEVAEKNFAKSLDRRSHYFKHSEKNINRPQTIVDSLDLIRYTQKPTILNTFEGLSKMEHINHYSEPKLDFQPGNTNNPFLVMYFENEQVVGILHDMIKDFIDAQSSSVDKVNVKRLFDDFVFPFVCNRERQSPLHHENLDYETIHESIINHIPIKEELDDNDVDASLYTTLNIMEHLKIQPQNQQPAETAAAAKSQPVNTSQELQKIKVLRSESSVPFLPVSSDLTKVFYGSQTIYTLLRLFYFLYEKILRAYELCYTFKITEAIQALSVEQKREIALNRFRLFICIFEGNLKSKEYSKMEENLKEVFGQSGYIFFSIIKLFEGMFKTAQSCISDTFSSELLQLYYSENESEEIYLYEVNQISLIYANSGRIVRTLCSPDNVVYFNLLESIYKAWYVDKKQIKDQPVWQRVADRVEAYLHGKKGSLTYNNDQVKKKFDVVILKNNHQYTTTPKSLQLISRNEDFLCRKRKQSITVRKVHLKEAKRASKLRSFMIQCLGDDTKIEAL